MRPKASAWSYKPSHVPKNSKVDPRGAYLEHPWELDWLHGLCRGIFELGANSKVDGHALSVEYHAAFRGAIWTDLRDNNNKYVIVVVVIVVNIRNNQCIRNCRNLFFSVTVNNLM